MGLVSCPDCNTRVSDAAPACPSCGRPIAGALGGRAYLDPRPTGTVQTIERTGKGLKLASLLTVPLLLVGIVVLCIGFSGNKPKDQSPAAIAVGFLMVFGAICWYILVRFLTWWRHG